MISNSLKPFSILTVKRNILGNLFVFLLQYSGLMFSQLGGSFAPINLATGTTLAFVFMRGARVLPGIWLGTFCACCSIKAGIFFSTECAFIYFLQAWLVFWMSQKIFLPTLIFYSRSDFLKFIFCCGFITAVMMLIVLNSFQLKFLTWVHWWLADFNSILIFTVGLITLDIFFPEWNKLQKSNLFNLSMIYGLIAICSVIVILTHNTVFISIALIALFVLTLLTIYKYQRCGIVAALCLIGFIFCLGNYFVASPFTITSIYIQIFLLFNAIVGLYLVAKAV